ncbi:hypothetical protein HMPREF9499_01027 [Enterococcus faecalis TX0012]|nr:hypothetical protein HMPREF9499_01027 [Enterococcus faecalis TX0012]
MENFGLFPKELVLSRRLSGFERGAKIQSDFCPRLLSAFYFKLKLP